MEFLRRLYNYVCLGYIYTILQSSVYVYYDESYVGASVNILRR
jgi:hypothetical protein